MKFGRQSQRRLFETIKYEEDGKMGLITLAQPKKLNAMSGVTYQEIPKALEKAAKSDVTVVGIIGEGKFYTSGTYYFHLLNLVNLTLTYTETQIIRSFALFLIFTANDYNDIIL